MRIVELKKRTDGAESSWRRIEIIPLRTKLVSPKNSALIRSDPSLSSRQGRVCVCTQTKDFLLAHPHRVYVRVRVCDPDVCRG